MADNTLCTEEALRWNLNDLPRSEYVDRRWELTPEQSAGSLIMGRITRRQDVRYLETHPEIRAITAMLLNAIWMSRPRVSLPDFCAEFFSRPRDAIERDLKPFLPVGHKTEDLKPPKYAAEICKAFPHPDDKDHKYLPQPPPARPMPSLPLEYEVEEEQSLTPSTISSISAVCTAESVHEEEEEVHQAPSIGSIEFTSSVEMMLNDLKLSLQRMRMRFGLEDIPEERESMTDESEIR